MEKALKEIIRLHDDEWSNEYRETRLASDMADIAREAIEKNAKKKRESSK
tara:strand:- start:406 stop:555 length:150 start_codon:yes stop_codon:yes gene_type:complete